MIKNISLFSILLSKNYNFFFFQKIKDKHFLAKECKKSCLRERKRPLDSMFTWWKENALDYESSMCLITAALNNNLKK